MRMTGKFPKQGRWSNLFYIKDCMFVFNGCLDLLAMTNGSNRETESLFILILVYLKFCHKL